MGSIKKAIIISLISLILSNISYAIPPIPMEFAGKITINGNDAPTNTIIKAYDSNNHICGQQKSIENGYYPFLSCIGDIKDTEEDEGAVKGDIITFYVNGIKAKESAIWYSGQIIILNLSIQTSQESPIPNTRSPRTSSNSGITETNKETILDQILPENTEPIDVGELPITIPEPINEELEKYEKVMEERNKQSAEPSTQVPARLFGVVLTNRNMITLISLMTLMTLIIVFMTIILLTGNKGKKRKNSKKK